MRLLYSMLVALSTPFLLVYFAVRGLHDRAYLDRLGERFGFIHPARQGGILVHAASVGEFNAASPLIRSLLKTYPEKLLSVTTLTPTGSERVRWELGDRVHHTYLPLDLPGSVKRFFDRLQPVMIIIMETEIWPNLFHQAKRRRIPLLIVNARLSEQSVGRYLRIGRLIKDTLNAPTWLGAQNTCDAERLIRCGAVRQRTEIVGNLKFDLTVPAGLYKHGKTLRARWGPGRPVLVAGSTHEEDEEVVVSAFVHLLENLPQALLILVPRHPERFARAAQAARAQGLRVELHSQGEACSAQAQCFVIDTMGALMTYIACADVVFVGGSMGEQGGHNPLEPAALGKAILVGPNTANAREVVTQLVSCGAAIRVNNAEDFQLSAEKLLGDGVLRKRMGDAGQALIEENKGALNLTLKAIERLI